MKHPLGAALGVVILLMASPATARHQRDAYCCPPTMVVSPAGALTCPGEEFRVSGTGFAGHEAVRIYFDDRLVETVRPDVGGSFSAVVVAPRAAPGQHTVLARHAGRELTALVTCVAEGDGGAVAFTGFVIRTWALVVAALLAVGGAALAAGRRRARSLEVRS